MSDNTPIEWADATVNAINGCSVTSPGCTHCYAMKLAGTRMRDHPTRKGLTIESKAGPVWNGEVRLHKPALLQPLAWKKPRRIFWNAHGDTFHEKVPDEWIDRVFAVAALTPQHTHMILTKRSARMRDYLTGFDWERAVENCREKHGASMITRHSIDSIRGHVGLRPRFSYERDASAWPLPNVWLGVSVEDQTRADERIPDLLATPAAVRFLSCEPLLGPVDLLQFFDPTGACCGGEPEYRCKNCPSDAPWRYSEPSSDGQWAFDPTIDWVIAGGESGPGARPMHPDWARSLRDQCADADVPFHFKQWGEWLPLLQYDADGHWHIEQDVDVPRLQDGQVTHRKLGKKRAGRLLDGVEHNVMPEVQA